MDEENKKEKVDIEVIYQLLARLEIFNSLNLEQVELYEDDKKIEVSKEIINEWRFIGLKNQEFIVSRYWERIEQNNEGGYL